MYGTHASTGLKSHVGGRRSTDITEYIYLFYNPHKSTRNSPVAISLSIETAI